MKRPKVQNCVDSGSKYCPCHLAYSGDCIRCNMLNINSCCNCEWQGVCVYNELMQNKDKKIIQREEYLCNIVSSKEVEEDIHLLKIKIPKELLVDLNNPGAYVLLKSKDRDKDIFNTPISVMDIDFENSILEVVIKTVGIKTKGIIEFDEVYVKAPYFNGIFGLKDINNTRGKNCLIVLNGLSQVNAINVIKTLLENENRVDVFLNNQGIILEEVVEKIMDLGANLYYSDLEQEPQFIGDYIKRNDINFVYSGAGVRFSKVIMKMIDSIDENIKLAISNNNLICCGEGICGACTVNINGEYVKTCKSQIDSRIYLKSIF